MVSFRKTYIEILNFLFFISDSKKFTFFVLFFIFEKIKKLTYVGIKCERNVDYKYCNTRDTEDKS